VSRGIATTRQSTLLPRYLKLNTETSNLKVPNGFGFQVSVFLVPRHPTLASSPTLP
jgi:hypothetical protein